MDYRCFSHNIDREPVRCISPDTPYALGPRLIKDRYNVRYPVADPDFSNARACDEIFGGTLTKLLVDIADFPPESA